MDGYKCLWVIILIIKPGLGIFMSGANYFGNLDFRNAKFQGSIRGNTIDGIGIFLDHQFLWVLSSWRDYVPAGPSLLVYPNRDIFYGGIRDNRLDGVCVLLKPTGESCFYCFGEGGERIAHLATDGTVMEIEESGNRLRMVRSYDSKGSDDLRWRIIGDILGTAVPPTHRNPKTYVREVFKRESNDMIECSESAGGAFVGFRNSLSLGIKIGKGDRVTSVGCFETFPRNLQFGRVYSDRGGKLARVSKVQQGKFGQNQRVFEYEGKRPAQAIKFTQQYFKRGTSFTNTFVKFPILEEISRHLRQIEEGIRGISILEYGQKILEGQNGNTDSEQKERYFENREYTLEEMKKEVQALVTRRNSTRRGGDRPFLQSDLRSSRERLRFIEEGESLSRSSHRDSPGRHRSKYKYMEELAKENQPIVFTQHKRRYAEPFPETSDFAHRLQEQIFNLELARIEEDRRRMVTPGRVFRPYEQTRTTSVYAKQKAVPEPVIKIKRVPSTSPAKQPRFRRYPVEAVPSSLPTVPATSKDPLTEQDGNWQPVPEESSQFQNYLKYKNRKKAEGGQSGSKKVYTMQEQETFNEVPNKKYEIYERRVLGSTNDPHNQQLPLPSPSESQGEKEGAHTSGLPRYRKNYKYL